MRKLILIIIILLIFVPTSSALAQADLTPPLPGTGGFKVDTGAKNLWVLRDKQVINYVGLRDNGGVLYKEDLEVRWQYKFTGYYTHVIESGEGYYAILYSVQYNTNFPQVVIEDKWANNYYLVVDNSNQVRDIVVTSTGNASYFLLVNGDENHKLALVTVKNRRNVENWFSDYLNQIVPKVRAGQIKLNIVSPPSKTDCQQTFNDMKNEFNDFYAVVADFVINKDHQYFRPKSGAEAIVDSMIPYQQAAQKLSEADAIGAFKALGATYDWNTIVFELKGQQKLEELTITAQDIKSKSELLEKDCAEFIQHPDNYPFEVRGINPNLTKKFQDWSEIKEQITKLDYFIEVLGKQAQGEPIKGPLADWENSVLKKVVCWLANAFISVLYWESNLAAFFLRRNY